MIRPIAMMLGALIAAPAAAQQVEIVSAGIFEAKQRASTVMGNGIRSNRVEKAQLTQSTDRIPARIGLRFGVQFRMTGVTDSLPLQQITRFPSPGVRPRPGDQPMLQFGSTIHCMPGDTCFTGYSFDETWELVPGTWTIEIWYRDKKLATQAFTVEKP